MFKQIALIAFLVAADAQYLRQPNQRQLSGWGGNAGANSGS
eukprot:CAMPEP_0178920046 /NCGR_PEP_ID=MMETSP0786-20121207/14783_1 /TAXON_ID=186022 /ORGANISM="Thalassionema frauenfeldii, Strain CCMP 1798" /LENGTH=40 /DNA_ID= /DNA_START= /DNA_END= /DNA_ORIENTATION=